MGGEKAKAGDSNLALPAPQPEEDTVKNEKNEKKITTPVFQYGGSHTSSILHKPFQVPGRGEEGGHGDNCLATHFDVAVIRCLFVSRWSEEGVFWQLHTCSEGL